MLHFSSIQVLMIRLYWNELVKCIKVYIALKKRMSGIDSLNIGGGFQNSLAFEYDYQYMIDEIINQIKLPAMKLKLTFHISLLNLFLYCRRKRRCYIIKFYIRNNKMIEKMEYDWFFFITTLPDTWAINKRFIMLAVNRWNETYERVLLGGLTCDSDDYYNLSKTWMLSICRNTIKKTIVHRVFLIQVLIRNNWVWRFTPLLNSTTQNTS
jgi:arginine decarboxylase